MTPVLESGKGLSLVDAFKLQNEIIRQGEGNQATGMAGYRVIGRLIELRHELASDGNAPGMDLTNLSPMAAEQAQRALSKTGLTMDWRHYHNGPILAVFPPRAPEALLIIGKVQPLPTIPDPDWRPTQEVQMAYGKVQAAQLSPEEIKKLGIKLEDRPMIKQDFMDHARGRLRNTAVAVVSPLTQALYKIEGLQGFNLIDFSSDVYNGTSPGFFINLETGEAHFCGGRFLQR